MSDLQLFYQLKEEVLLAYQKLYPFFRGSWKTFSSRDIQNLIDAIEKETKQTISEKWIYIHLKPEANQKLPRKDMLDILSRFTGYSGWDEFQFKNREQTTEAQKKRPFTKLLVFVVLLILTVILYGMFTTVKSEKQTLEKPMTDNNEMEILQKETVTLKEEGKAISLQAKEDTHEIKKEAVDEAEKNNSFLQADDYVMILKAFMLSDIKDWETRKEQLDKILSDDLEVIIMLKDNLGAEYFNKTEFAQKLIIPTASVRKLKITDLQTDDKNQVRFIRIKQE